MIVTVLTSMPVLITSMTLKYGVCLLKLLKAAALRLPCIVSEISYLGVVKDIDCGILHYGDVHTIPDRIVDYTPSPKDHNCESEHSDHSRNARRCALGSLDKYLISE